MKKINFGKIAGRFMPAPLRYYWDNRATSPVGYRLAHGAFWSMIGTGIPQAITMITSILVARMLGKELLGQYGMVINTIGLFNMFAFFGIGMTSIKHVAEFRKSDPDKAGRIIALLYLVAIVTSVFMIAALYAFSPWLAEKTLAAPHLSSLLRLGVVIILLSSFNSVQLGTLSGLEAFRPIARINILNGIFAMPISLGAIYFFSLPGAVSGFLVISAVNCILSNIEVRKATREAGVTVNFRGCTREAQVLLGYSMPVVLAGIMFTPASWACSALLVNNPGGYAEMGIFSVASSWQKVIFFIPQCLNAIALPMLSDFHGAKQRRQYLKTFMYNIALIGSSSLGIAVVIVLASTLIMSIYGAEFMMGSSVLTVLSFSAVIIVIDTFVGVSILSIGRTWFLAGTATVWAAISIISSYLLIPILGAIGLSLALASAYLFRLLCNGLYIAKYYSNRS